MSVPVYDDDTRDAILVGGEVLHRVHRPGECANQTCVIHNPSDHHMREWTQHWRGDRRIMERICEHGTGHPDPDDITSDTTHGCDGCCRRPPTMEKNPTMRVPMPPVRQTTPSLLNILGAVALLLLIGAVTAFVWGWIIMIGVGFSHSHDASIPALGWMACTGLGFPFASLSLVALGSNR